MLRTDNQERISSRYPSAAIRDSVPSNCQPLASSTFQSSISRSRTSCISLNTSSSSRHHLSTANLQFNAIIICAIVGSTAAAPTPQVQAKRDVAEIEKRQSPVALAVGGAVLGGFVGPIVTRVFINVFGMQSKRDIGYSRGDLSFAKSQELFISKSAEAFYDEDEKDEAAVGVSVGYPVSDPSKTGDSASFRFQANGETVDCDCFVLEGPSTFTDATNATAADVAVKVGTNGSFKLGIPPSSREILTALTGMLGCDKSRSLERDGRREARGG